MNVNQLKINLQELESNLANETVQVVLKNNNFELGKLENSIKSYYKNIEQIKDEDLLKKIESKINELISYSNESNFHSYIHKFINAANFLIANTPVESTNIDNNFDALNEIKISEEEFSKRYDKLIETLNFEDEESNLVLETPSGKKPFKVYKTKTKSLAIYAISSEKPMIISADRLLEVAFKRKDPTYSSYELVLISKIMDNTIFDFVSKSLQNDLVEAMKDKLLKNENELLILRNELDKIQKENQEFSATKQQLSEILTESKTVKQEYIFAKEAAVNDSKLKASVAYWDEKKDKHKKQFWIYMSIAIVAIGTLIFILSDAIKNHNTQTDLINKIEVTSKTFDKNITKLETKKSTNEVNKQEENKIFNSFDYTKLGWYVLMIFASSSVFWIIRITVKIALSNLHLSEDANERVVMIQTYLSFVQEGHGLEEKDKRLILSSLFRPSNIGIIKDESSVTVADIVTAFKK